MERAFIKPVKGKRVRDPDDGFSIVPESGKEVEWYSFWHRRLADGDITIVATEPVIAEPKPDTAKTKKEAK